MLLHAPTRKSVAAFGAVRVADGSLVTGRQENFNAASFLTFLKQLLRRRRHGRKMVVILDNASWHRARELHAWLLEHVETLTLPRGPGIPTACLAHPCWLLAFRVECLCSAEFTATRRTVPYRE